MNDTKPQLRDSTIIGPYRVEVWQENGGCFRVEVLKEGRMVRGPFRYSWLEQALEVSHGMSEIIRTKVLREG